MERRELLKSLAAFTAAGSVRAEAAVPGKNTTRRPNILVFLTDDHAQWLQQAYGNSEVLTPNMSRIARNGVLMRNAFTTCPVCSPARASFFTGRMPSQHGIHDWIEESKQAYAAPWLEGQTLISELLRDAGYHTGLVGKWHCGFEREPRPGFDHWYSFWVNQYPHMGRQQFSDNGRKVEVEGLQSTLLTDQALAFLKQHASDPATKQRPFFLFVGYTDTHSPHTQMPEETVAHYKDASFRDIPRESFNTVHGRPLIPVTADAAAERARQEQYYAAASTIDREIGRVLEALEASHQLDDTLVVYTGDHGLNAGQHGMWEKGNATIPQNFLEESIRVPCAISWPKGGVVRGLESEREVNHCDLFATLLEAAGATPNSATAAKINSPGRSYLPHLRGETEAALVISDPPQQFTQQLHDGMIFCEYGNARMLRADSYKLILRYPYKGVRFGNELYDLKADPRETQNLIDKPEHAERVAKMIAQIDGFFAHYTVPGHDGLHLEEQPMATPASPWLAALKEAPAK